MTGLRQPHQPYYGRKATTWQLRRNFRQDPGVYAYTIIRILMENNTINLSPRRLRRKPKRLPRITCRKTAPAGQRPHSENVLMRTSSSEHRSCRLLPLENTAVTAGDTWNDSRSSRSGGSRRMISSAKSIHCHLTSRQRPSAMSTALSVLS